MGLIAIFSLFGFAALDEYGLGSGMGVFMFLGYGIIAFIYILPAVWLLNFSTKTRKGINEKDESKFAEGFKNLGKYYTFFGVISIIFLSIYALIFLIGIIAAIAAS